MIGIILLMCLCFVPMMVLDIVNDIYDIRHPKNEDKWYEFLEQYEKDYNECKRLIREIRERA